MLSALTAAAGFAFEIFYFVSISFLSAMGLHRYRICWLRLKTRAYPQKIPPPPPDSGLPLVTVQLPIYNEFYVAKRLIDAVCGMDYPHMEIQVLDDSDDETSRITAEVVLGKQSEGINIRHIRRKDRRGYKAGALHDALASAKGRFIALFDADFVPERDFLRRAVGCFSDPRVGIAQARWGHINLNQSLLTRLQAVFLDGHFLVEQSGRSAAGLFLNFNGTACVIRRACLESSGGWHEDTMAEDLDLSCRAQLNGWKIKYMPELVCPAELPPDVAAFKSQQRRWACGGMQNAVKFLPEIFSRKDLSFAFKAEAAFHMLGNLSSPLFLIAVVSGVAVNYLGGAVPAKVYVAFGAAAFAASGGIFAFFALAALEQRKNCGLSAKLSMVPLAVVFWAGMTVNNTGAVIRSLAGKNSEFVRTPKTASTNAAPRLSGVYGAGFDSAVPFEIAAALLLVFFALRPEMDDPFFRALLFLFSAAFAYVSALSVKQRLRRFYGGS